MSANLLTVFRLLVAVVIPLASFVAGLLAREPLWLFRRPRLLGRSLLAILVVVPVLAAFLLELLSADDVYVRVGVTVSILAIGIGPPNLMKRSHSRKPSADYEVGLDVVLLPLAIAFMPLATALHGAVYGHDVRLSPVQVGRVVVIQALLPFAVGFAVAKLAPNVVQRLARYAELFVTGAFLIVLGFALFAFRRPLIAIGASGWLTCAAVAVVSVLAGHVLGGPGREAKGVLAAYSAIRFPGLALLLVSVVPQGQRLIPVVLAYIIASTAIVGVYAAATAPRRKTARADRGISFRKEKLPG